MALDDDYDLIAFRDLSGFVTGWSSGSKVRIVKMSGTMPDDASTFAVPLTIRDATEGAVGVVTIKIPSDYSSVYFVSDKDKIVKEKTVANQHVDCDISQLDDIVIHGACKNEEQGECTKGISFGNANTSSLTRLAWEKGLFLFLMDLLLPVTHYTLWRRQRMA